MTVTSNLLILLAHSQTSQLPSKKAKAQRHTVRELSRKIPEAKLFARSCDVPRRGNPLGNASIEPHSNASTSTGLARLLQSSLAKILRNEKQRYGDLPWTQTEKDDALAKCRLGLRAWRATKTTALS